MPEIKREFTNFAAGELTYHESIEGGEMTAQIMQNLRADSEGRLAHRHSIRTTLTANPNNITGIAAAPNGLFFITDTGRLFFRKAERLGQTDVEIPIHGRPRIRTEQIPDGYIEGTQLQERISIITEYEDFYILTSEGEDKGYWIDVRDENDIKAYPLGFNPPDFTVNTEFLTQGSTTIQFSKVYYRFTYIRDTRTEQEIRQGILPEGEEDTRTFIEAQEENPVIEPFFNVESNPSSPLFVTIPAGSTAVRLRGIRFPNPDGLERGIAIYRSRPVSTAEIERGENGRGPDLDYRRIGFYETLSNPPPGSNPPAREEAAAFDDNVSEENRKKQITLRTDNDRMPSTVKQFTLYNDRIYAPDRKELRYSDVRFGNLYHWAFPKTNSIRRPVDCEFAAAYRDMLLFGGRNGTWRLVGNPPLPDLTRLSNLGAINPYAMTRTDDVFGYISPAGLHISDGVTTQDVSEPIQENFENQTPIDGDVLFLPNGHSLFSVEFARLDGSTHRETFYRGRQFTRWADVSIRQSARVEQVEITHDIKTVALIAENTPFIRQILYENINSEFDSNETGPTLIPINWKWKSHKLEFAQEGLKTKRKRFTELIIEGVANTIIDGEESPITATFTIYDQNGNTTTLTKTAKLTRQFLYNTRIPIQRIGLGIEFEITGRGRVRIGSLCLKGNI